MYAAARAIRCPADSRMHRRSAASPLSAHRPQRRPRQRREEGVYLRCATPSPRHLPSGDCPRTARRARLTPSASASSSTWPVAFPPSACADTCPSPRRRTSRRPVTARPRHHFDRDRRRPRTPSPLHPLIPPPHFASLYLGSPPSASFRDARHCRASGFSMSMAWSRFAALPPSRPARACARLPSQRASCLRSRGRPRISTCSARITTGRTKGFAGRSRDADRSTSGLMIGPPAETCTRWAAGVEL